MPENGYSASILFAAVMAGWQLANVCGQLNAGNGSSIIWRSCSWPVASY